MEHYAFSAAEISTATDAALETLEWSTPGPGAYGEPGPEYLDGTDAEWSDAARERMREIVNGFMSDDRVSRLFDLLTLYGLTFTPEQIGHDLVLTANRHGAGFWDRDYRPRPHAALEAISDVARPYGEIGAYLSDAGMLEIQG